MSYLANDIKKVIGGKRYNTATAKYITNHSYEVVSADVNNFYEELYQKKTGEFFLAGIGGALSKYGQTLSGGIRQGGEGIIPLSLQEAQDWVEKYANEFYEDLFIIEEDEVKSFSLLMPDDLYQKIAMFASVNDFYMKDFVIYACRKLFEDLPDEFSSEYEKMIGEIRGSYLS